MAHPLRIEYPGALYHLTSRGNARADIYLSDRDRQLFPDILEEVCARLRWVCYAYCLMSNHYHLMIETRHTGKSFCGKHLRSEEKSTAPRLAVLPYANQ